jgi:hypothetical protein
VLALGSQSGCTREFFREWANSDVTEAIYEKSRDPRYRLDMFTIDPPAYSRFADNSDPDRPPAPPDDAATEALSPVPQWPEYRLIMPMEGTGYLRMLDDGPRYDSPPPYVPKPRERLLPKKPVSPPPPPLDNSPFNPNNPPATNPGAPSANPANPGPGASRSNSGTGPVAMSPTSLAGKAPQAPASATPARVGLKDDGVQLAATQDPASPMPTQIPSPPPRTPATSTNRGDAIQTPKISQDPLPVDPNLRDPSIPPRRDQTPEEYRRTEEAASNIARMFVPENVPFDEAIAAGLPSNSKPYVLTMEKAFQLAIVNARVYQYQLENIYINALPVTLQRFSFQPQFIAGLSPSTGIAGAGSGGGAGGGILPTQSPVNQFLYATRATGSQTSTLNYGTVAGVGKMFDNGAKVLASFARQESAPADGQVVSPIPGGDPVPPRWRPGRHPGAADPGRA